MNQINKYREMTHDIRIKAREALNHNVIRFTLEKPAGFIFTAGQAIELSMTDGPTAGNPAPFTLTNLPSDPDLELMIKIYRDHGGITAALENATVGSRVTISDAWDSYVNRGPGVFLAGGAGITPFIALLRSFRNEGTVGESTLFFSNKNREDIFNGEELNSLVSGRLINILTQEGGGYVPGRLDTDLIVKHVGRNLAVPFYVCGPPGFVDHCNALLAGLGVDQNSVVVSL